MTVTEFIKKYVPFLKGLSEEQASCLANTAEQKPFIKGQTVIFQGATVEGLYIVAQGKVTVHVHDVRKRETIRVAELGPGEVFGETSVVELTMAGATVKSAADDTLIFIIPESAFNKILAADEKLKTRTLALIESRRQTHPGLKKKTPDSTSNN